VNVFDLREIYDKCESPIERLMAAGFVAVHEAGLGQINFVLNGHGVEANKADIEDWQRFHGLWLHVFPQERIDRYRVDFLVMCVNAFCWPGQAPKILRRGIVVECDGKEFHRNKRKEEARTSFLYHQCRHEVMRFSGSDIWRRASRCADEVAEKACRLTDLPGSGWYNLTGPIAGPDGVTLRQAQAAADALIAAHQYDAGGEA
jgi:very-short-patch-repair endonuclease